MSVRRGTVLVTMYEWEPLEDYPGGGGTLEILIVEESKECVSAGKFHTLARNEQEAKHILIRQASTVLPDLI